jgi:acyl-coenzyme A thioesterase PaaI-like protein
MQKESFKTWWFRFWMNLYPMFLGTGGRITFIAADWREVRVRLRLNLWTYNYVGTIFGGSMFAASDPFYMLMLYRTLGPDYVVWDKAAHIRFRRPGKSRLGAQFLLTEAALAEIKAKVAAQGETDYPFTLQWVDQAGQVHAEVERTVYVATKDFYAQKRQAKAAKATS